jgi:hypothetical protein
VPIRIRFCEEDSLRRTQWFFLPVFLWLFAAPPAFSTPNCKTENVILLTLDGARTQEIFAALDVEILKSLVRAGSLEEHPTYRKYWASTPQERREKLMPFFWGTWMTQHGYIYGNRLLGSIVQITNTYRFSYPGYSEILTGQSHDDVINSNANKPNPYSIVLEFLKRKLQLGPEQAAAFASWDTMSSIAEHEKGVLRINAGYQAYNHPDSSIRLLSQLQFETLTPWASVRHDLYTFSFAMSHLRMYKPRVLYISLGETDDWAHDGRYDLVLEALRQTDNRLRQLWGFLQHDDQYREKTSIVLSTDHGRGNGPTDWRDHGKDVEGAQYIWLAVVSPDDPRRGEQKNCATVYQNQIAATLCRFLKLDYAENNPNAGSPIPIE